jgi:hypothetical protein
MLFLLHFIMHVLPHPSKCSVKKEARSFALPKTF